MLSVSIIIPVYNTEEYLPKCLDSVLSQTFTNFECILVEDGSTDSSGKICDDYASFDTRFKVIHQKKSGVSNARNVGLAIATGKWIAFVDSDDWIEPDMLEVAIGAAEKAEADIIQWNYITEGGKIQNKVPLKDGFFQTNEKKELPCWFSMIWSRLYSRSLLTDNGIIFDTELFFGEDGLFSVHALACASKIWNVENALYHYRARSGSAVSTMDIKAVDNKILAAKKIEAVLKKLGKDRDFNMAILQKKRGARDSLLFDMKNPDFDRWRKTFPEINSSVIRIYDKKVIMYLALFMHFDFLAGLMIRLYKNR